MSDKNQNTISQDTQAQAPGLIAAHAEYVKGAVSSTIGSVTGSQPWTASGEQAKAHAVSDMKAASVSRDPKDLGFGKVEEVVGKVAGCEGMEKEGKESVKGTEQDVL
ncbi:hypothetical protein BJ878DRAFT_504320 [Calycina marina]|uniref:CsbD-like domain-containing protein n=1 Tax=Calycina marina TaxID=1763456 RepID=A0A9P7Z3W2_9HELO|nr:hypothetical protein BJ878DRAFT_504320 [Calycina marina]